ncbi:MAG: hypothetical protein ACPHXR_09470 [Flavicella sp.]
MSVKNIWIAVWTLLLISCSEVETPQTPIEAPTEGYTMLLMGNSFFKPYANHLDTLALHAGLEKHNSTTVFRGGENGRPINFWRDTDSNEHQLIKATLDQGNIDVFGMTSGHDPEDRTEGHRAWIEYAIEKNPDITIFIAIPAIDFPADWQQRAEEYGFDTIDGLYDYFVNDLVNKTMVDELREKFPTTTIFTIPTGLTALNLYNMYTADNLSDDIALFGEKPSALFTDAKGHQGQIVIETGTLLWLHSIYNTDLSSFSYDTGFQTDLHGISAQIAAQHDVNYKK